MSPPFASRCGYCLSNNIRDDMADSGSPCLTCLTWNLHHSQVDTERCDGIRNPEDLNLENNAKQLHEAYYTPISSSDILQFTVPRSRHSVNFNNLLPSFITELPLHMPSGDAYYLKKTGAFTLPDMELRNELLNKFIHNVHPYLPVLDLPEFLQAIAINDGTSRVSLLLFHAVMFSGTAFVESEYLCRAGYTSRKAARRDLFKKAKVLYDFDLERDRIVLLQSVLLLTCWHETPDDPKDSRYWIEIALSLATSIGLNECPGYQTKDTSYHLRKRIWWSLYTRDRLLALNFRQPTVIRDDKINISPPTVDDFNIQCFPSDSVQMLGGVLLLQSIDHQRQLAQAFVELAKLCSVINFTISPTCKCPLARETTTRYFKKLAYWEVELQDDLRYELPPSCDLPEVEMALLTYRAWLKMLFLTAINTLQRHQTSQNVIESVENFPRNLIEYNIQNTTREITTIAEGLSRVGIVHLLPTIAVGLIIPILTIHVVNIRSGIPELWFSSFQSSYLCMKILEQLGQSYTLADAMASFFESALCGDRPVHVDHRPFWNPTALLENVLTSAELKFLSLSLGHHGHLSTWAT